ncbi:MAG TPA: hypothetical protein VIU64_01530 [Polyangia bacterium]
MKPTDSTFVAAARVRQALVEDGDIRGEIEFQNDINGMIARLDDGSSWAVAVDWVPIEPLAAAAAAARRRGLRHGRHGRRAALPPETTSGPYVSIAVSRAR